MKKICCFLGITAVITGLTGTSLAQKHLANGELVEGGNRLISVLSENGKQLYQPGRIFFPGSITVDGRMTEPEWNQALNVTPFFNAEGILFNVSVRVWYGKENIYLFWQIPKTDGLTSLMAEQDGIITGDDYVQVDLRPWLPDSISDGTGYYYSIAVNPSGIIWDACFDPYLDGFFFSSWNSGAVVASASEADRWQVEMIIPFPGLDVSSDPGWKWNLEFYHCSQNSGTPEISSSNIGVTVQQDVMVRQPGLVSYYWPRPEFMQEVKPEMSTSTQKHTEVLPLASLPKIDSKEDIELWAGAEVLAIDHTDRMGQHLLSNAAAVRIGMAGDKLCFNLDADGAVIKDNQGPSGKLGEGMAAQMAGVNGVFVDQALFRSECFWIIIQPWNKGADKIHQDYYLLQVDNSGEARGTHYDEYGAPLRTWKPEVDIDIYNTDSGWGAEVILDLECMDITVDYSHSWGMNLFRNRLTEEGDSELQAWKFTGNDFLDPQRFGELSGITFKNNSVFCVVAEREAAQIKAGLKDYRKGNPQLVQELETELKSLKTGSAEQLRAAGTVLQQIDHTLGIIDAISYYKSAPHPAGSSYPLMDIQFIGDNGWAVGAMGTILLTRDGGSSWQKIRIDSDADLYRVRFVNKNLGWAAGGRIRMAATNESMRHDQRGGYAYIYHTEDGGKTWKCQYGERGRHLFAMDFTDEYTGYVAGERGFFMKTTDGGEHWNVLPVTGTLNWLYGMTFVDRDKGFAVGMNETVIRTIDGGKTWEKLDAQADRKFYGFRSIYRDICFNGSTGCIVGQNGCILISHDAGETWEPSATFYKNEIRELTDLRSVHFVSPLCGYAVGELGTKIMMTDDGGLNWSYRNTGQSEWLRVVWAEPSGRLFLVGERGKVLGSPDRGLTWKTGHGEDTKIDVMVMMAHGDDAPLNLNSFFAYYSVNEGKRIIDAGVMSDVHSSEYEETYNLEHDRDIWLTGTGTSTNFVQFETGNNGANYYHYNQRLWEGEGNAVRHMVAAIRAYRPDIVITHGGILGDYDKPGHKLSGRAGLRAFETSGGTVDQWPELTRIGLKPWAPKKLYCLASESYPATIDLTWIGKELLKGTGMTCQEYGNYVIRNFQSQGVYYHTGSLKLCLIKTLVPVPEKENSVFDGLDE